MAKSFFDDKPGTTLNALETVLFDLAVPRNGLNGGAGYGQYRGEDGTWTHTFGSFFADKAINNGDRTNATHDKSDRDHLGWVQGQLSVVRPERATGVLGLAYAAVGIGSFSLAGFLK